jgi:hypothetical protein
MLGLMDPYCIAVFRFVLEKLRVLHIGMHTRLRATFKSITGYIVREKVYNEWCGLAIDNNYAL